MSRTEIENISLYRIITITFFLLFLVPSKLLAERGEIGKTKVLFTPSSITVEGLKLVEPEAILSKITLEKNKALTNYDLKKSIERIYRLKYFDSVEAYKSGTKLVFKVVEKPLISKIWVRGNEEVSDDDLTELLKSKENTILDINTINKDLLALQKHYEEKGFYLATIRHQIKKAEGKNKSVELIFNVKEFDKIRVKKITFLGNTAFSDAELKSIMETREEGLFSFMNSAGNFKEFNFQTDIERLKYFYKTKGHLQINIAAPQVTISEDKRWVFITLKLNEGPQFTVNDITFQGEVLFTDDELRSRLNLQGNDTYSEEKLRKDIQYLTEKYQDKGYAFANVLRNIRLVPGENKVDIQYSFEKGKIAYFGKIVVKGNSKTRDKVVRRELRIREGQQFSGTELRLSRENVNRLGFFEPGSVVFNTITRKGADNILDVEVRVKERNTGQISLGAGYSTATGMFVQASIAQNNFRGLGQNLSFSLSLSKTNQTFNLGFTEPYLFDSKWTAGFDIFRQDSSTSDAFSYKRKGFALRGGHPIAEYTRLYVTYKLEDTSIKNITDPTINEALENGIASSIGATIVTDKRNNKFEPSAGHYISFSTEFAGVGGDKKWGRYEFDARYFKRVIGDLVLRTRFYTGALTNVNGQQIPRTEKFTLGGARNLRGYGLEGVGPKDTVLVDGIEREFNLRGQYSLFTNIEFEHPLAREAGLKWVIFFDAGNIYNRYIGKNGYFGLKSDYGFGFRWFSPIGVLRFEFGYPISAAPGEGGSQFHFDIGQIF